MPRSHTKDVSHARSSEIEKSALLGAVGETQGWQEPKPAVAPSLIEDLDAFWGTQNTADGDVFFDPDMFTEACTQNVSSEPAYGEDVAQNVLEVDDSMDASVPHSTVGEDTLDGIAQAKTETSPRSSTEQGMH